MRRAEFLQQFGSHRAPGALLVIALEASAQVRPQPVDGTVAQEARRECVVERGQLRLLDLVHRDGEHGFLAGQRSLGIAGRELSLDLFGLARLHPEDAGGKPGNESILADFGRLALRASAGERLAVHCSDEVQRRNVARLNRPVDGGKLGRAASQSLQVAGDLVVRDARVGRGDFETLVLAERDLRAHGDRRAQAQVAAGRLFGGHQFHLRPLDGFEVVLRDGLRVRVGNDAVERALLDARGAVGRLENLARRLTRPETGDPRIARQFAVRRCSTTELLPRNRPMGEQRLEL